MKRTKAFSVFFAVLGILLAVSAAGAVFLLSDAQPILLGASGTAAKTAASLMDALCDGDYDAAEQLLYGQPDLGLDRAPAEPVGQLLWDAYRDSLTYTLDGECYASENGLKQNVKITALDLTAVTAEIGARLPDLLESRSRSMEDSQVYDVNREYREAFVNDVLLDTAEAALKDASATREYSLVLTLIHQEGNWRVVADEPLLTVISGGVSG